jgi:hypothetical protein
MDWYVYLAYFFAGVFLANGVPHFTQGICGNRFQSPFASPPGVGESSAMINALWGLANFAAGLALVVGVGDFSFGLNREVLIVGVGGLVTAVSLAWHFGRVRAR